MKKAIVTIALLAIVSITCAQTKSISNHDPDKAILLEKPYYLNDTIWALDSSLQQKVTEDEFVNQRKSIIQSHDEQGRNTSTLWKSWHSAEETWLNNTYDSVEFYPSGTASEKLSYDWNTNENNWKLTFFNKISENRIQIERIQLNWNNDRNKYLYGFRQWTEFDETELPQNTFWNDFDSISQDFTTGKRTTFFYDENNLNTFTLWEKWNELTQDWDPNINAEMFYNTEGLLIQRVFQEWDLDVATWQNTSKSITGYNTSGLVDTNALYNWLPLYSIWYPSQRLILTYDEQDKLVKTISQKDGFGDEVWINESRVLQVFENDILIEKRKQNWVSGDWMDDRIELFSYINDTLFESQTFINYDPYNEVYDTSMRWVTLYNDRFIPEKFLSQTYSEESSEFVTYLQRIFYFSPLAGPDAVGELELLDFRIYPNPSSGIFQLALPEGSGESRFIVSNLSGQVVNEGSIQVGSNLKIDLSNKANGVYFIRVVSDNKQGVKKMVKF